MVCPARESIATSARPDSDTLQRLIDASPDAIVIVDRQWRIVHANAQVQQLFGYSPDELLGQAVEVLVPAGLRVAPAAHRERYPESPVARLIGPDRGLLGLHKDGTEFPVEVSVSAVTTSRGTRAMCAIRDARELVSHTVHALLDSLPVGVLLRDAQTSITLTNAAARAMLGDKFPGAPDGHTLHRPDGSPLPADATPLRRAIERGEATADETLIIRSVSGEERVHLVAATPVRDPHGRLVAAVAVFQDITELKRAEEDLARLSQTLATERSRVQAILDSASNAIIYVDAATDHVQANPEAERLFGRPIVPEDGRAQYIGQIQDPEGHAVPRQDLPASRALRGDTPQRRELLIARSDGARVPVLANAAPVRTPDGHVPGAVVVLQDISALKELERLREEWTSVVAHDLRQPVALIGGYAGLLARDLATASPQLKAHVEDIRAGARQLNRMIADLLDASRLEAQRLALARRPVDLGALVREVVERAAPLTNGHAVRVRVQGAIPPLDVDPGRIEQVLVNLLSNAAKYGRAETPIEVRVAARGSEIEVAVTNEGPGIPPDELGALFARFHRARSARRDATSGIGLGLYIARGLVEAHGGRIGAQSVPGETTTFRFTLPV